MYRSFLIILFTSTVLFLCGCSDSNGENRIYSNDKCAVNINPDDFDFIGHYGFDPNEAVLPGISSTIHFDANSGLFADGTLHKRVIRFFSYDFFFPNDVMEPPISETKTFIGWAQKPNGIVINNTLCAESTFYAQWLDTPPQPTAIIFDANGGKFENGEEKLIVTGQSGSGYIFWQIPIGLKINDMHFAGWADKRYDHFDSLADIPKTSKFILVKEPVTYYAIWVKIPPQKATFGFSVKTGFYPEDVIRQSFDIIPGMRVALADLLAKPSLDGYQFIGWREFDTPPSDVLWDHDLTSLFVDGNRGFWAWYEKIK